MDNQASVVDGLLLAGIRDVTCQSDSPCFKARNRVKQPRYGAAFPICLMLCAAAIAVFGAGMLP